MANGGWIGSYIRMSQSTEIKASSELQNQYQDQLFSAYITVRYM